MLGVFKDSIETYTIPGPPKVGYFRKIWGHKLQKGEYGHNLKLDVLEVMVKIKKRSKAYLRLLFEKSYGKGQQLF